MQSASIHKKERAIRILLATDGSEFSEAAGDEIARRHFPADSEVRVISVFEVPIQTAVPSDAGVDMLIYDGLERATHERASVAVAKAVAKLREGDDIRPLNFTTEVLSGSPKRVILEEAEKFGADLIVVGSHGHGMLERFLLGSVSQAVALHAKCSVEIVRSAQTQASESK